MLRSGKPPSWDALAYEMPPVAASVWNQASDSRTLLGADQGIGMGLRSALHFAQRAFDRVARQCIAEDVDRASRPVQRTHALGDHAHALARLRSSERGGQAGESSADYQEIKHLGRGLRLAGRFVRGSGIARHGVVTIEVGHRAFLVRARQVVRVHDAEVDELVQVALGAVVGPTGSALRPSSVPAESRAAAGSARRLAGSPRLSACRWRQRGRATECTQRPRRMRRPATEIAVLGARPLFSCRMPTAR